MREVPPLKLGSLIPMPATPPRLSPSLFHPILAISILFKRFPYTHFNFHFQARIDMVHEAVTKGHLEDVRALTKFRSPVFSVLKAKPENLINSIDSAGAGLLHKAVFYDHVDLVRWLAENFPKSVHVRDKVGHSKPAKTYETRSIYPTYISQGEASARVTFTPPR